MIYGLYHSAAGMLTNEYREAVLANNIANAETVGFKREVATFAERSPAAEAGRRAGPTDETLDGMTGGLWLGATRTDFRPGAMVHTDDAYDVALDGPGFLVVAQDGQPRYTRDGRMTITPTGELVAASDGAPVLGRSGTPLRLNPRGGEPRFDENGRVFQDERLAGQLAVVDFADYRALTHAGTTRFAAADDAEMIASPAFVRAGVVEASGVEPVQEMVSMLDAARAYQLNARMVSLQDSSVGQLITQLLRV
jgi:flagellar basal-body rod protein FlgF